MAFASINQASVGGGSSNALAIQSDGIFMPRLSTGQRTALALTTSDAGLTVYDFTLNNLFIWNGTAWESIPGSGDAGANGSVQYNDAGIVSGATNFVWDKVNGRVGIGTASPSQILSIQGPANQAFLIADDSTATFRAIYGVDSVTGGGVLGCISNHPVIFRVNNTEAMRLNTTANLVLKGGTANANGVGVTFPATQVASSDANCLDDYEEGTFTPTVIGTTTAGIGVYTNQAGRYTKVGRLVTVEIDLGWSAHTGTGNMQFAGLPFTINGTVASSVTLGYVSNIALTAGNIMIGYTDTNGTLINLHQTPTGGGAATPVPIDPAGRVICSLTYSV